MHSQPASSKTSSVDSSTLAGAFERSSGRTSDDETEEAS
jgi:hypothetical protein